MSEVCELPETAGRWRAAWWRALVGLGLCGVALAKVDAASLLARLSQLRAGWVLLGAALTIPQLFLLALRWRVVARALGMPLSRREALREYSLSFLLNQVLPLGVVGDGLRVLRQRQKAASWAGALHSVLLERALGQVLLAAWVLSVLPLWLGERGAWLALGLAAVGLSVLWRWRARGAPAERGAAWRAQLNAFVSALARILTSRRTFVPALGLSALILVSIAVQLYCALRSLDLALAPLTAAKVFPLLLLSMSVPLSFAGFGPREAAATSLFGAMQLSRADGLAFSVAFGTLLLCSVVPSLSMALWFGRDERAD